MVRSFFDAYFGKMRQSLRDAEIVLQYGLKQEEEEWEL